MSIGQLHIPGVDNRLEWLEYNREVQVLLVDVAPHLAESTLASTVEPVGIRQVQLFLGELLYCTSRLLGKATFMPGQFDD